MLAVTQTQGCEGVRRSMSHVRTAPMPRTRHLLDSSATDDVAPYAASTMQELVTLVARGIPDLRVNLSPTQAYIFTSDYPRLVVPSGCEARVDCHGATLADCAGCGAGAAKFFLVGSNSALHLANCNINTGSSVLDGSLVAAAGHWMGASAPGVGAAPPTEGGLVPSDFGDSTFADPLGSNSTFSLQNSRLMEGVCGTVSLTQPRGGNPRLIVGSYNTSYVEVIYASPPLRAANTSIIFVNSTVECPPSLAGSPEVGPDPLQTQASTVPVRVQSTSKLAGWVLPLLISVVALVAALIAVLVVVKRSQWRQLKSQRRLRVTGSLRGHSTTRTADEPALTGSVELEVTPQVGNGDGSFFNTAATLSEALACNDSEAKSEPASSKFQTCSSGCQSTLSGVAEAGGPSRDNQREVQEICSEFSMDQIQVSAAVADSSVGSVYSGMWRGLNVAIEALRIQGQPTTSREAIEESMAYGSLVHKNIVAIFAYQLKQLGTDSWKLYVVQELCNGGNVSSLLTSGILKGRHGGARLTQFLPLLLEVARGMEHLHGNNIVHGDLTPNNILLQLEKYDESAAARDSVDSSKATTNGRCTAKIVHVGLRAVLGISTTGMAGASFYHAPEAQQTDTPLTPASDVFSFGVLMWSLCHNSAPFVIRGGSAVRHPQFPKFMCHIPLNYTLLAVACMSQDPQSRPTFPQIVQVLSDIFKELRRGLYIDSRGQSQSQEVVDSEAPSHSAASQPSTSARDVEPFALPKRSIPSPAAKPGALRPVAAKRQIPRSRSPSPQPSPAHRGASARARTPRTPDSDDSATNGHASPAAATASGSARGSFAASKLPRRPADKPSRFDAAQASPSGARKVLLEPRRGRTPPHSQDNLPAPRLLLSPGQLSPSLGTAKASADALALLARAQMGGASPHASSLTPTGPGKHAEHGGGITDAGDESPRSRSSRFHISLPSVHEASSEEASHASGSRSNSYGASEPLPERVTLSQLTSSHADSSAGPDGVSALPSIGTCIPPVGGGAHEGEGSADARALSDRAVTGPPSPSAVESLVLRAHGMGR